MLHFYEHRSSKTILNNTHYEKVEIKKKGPFFVESVGRSL